MKFILVTDQVVEDILSSFTADTRVINAVNKVIFSMGESYTEFLYNILTNHSTDYIKLNSPECPLGQDAITHLLARLNVGPFPVRYEDVLIADRMDILYGTDVRSYAEFSKFSPSFYGGVEEDFYAVSDHDVGLVNGEEINEYNDIYLSSIRELERLVSAIEQLIMVNADPEAMEDIIILGLGKTTGMLYLYIY